MTIHASVVRWSGSTLRAKRRVLLLSIMMCAVAISVIAIERANRRFEGPLRGADFVHFYTLGHLAYTQQVSAMYDMSALHDAQVALVPDSETFLYPPVYPPQISLLFVPVTGWSYETSLFVWNALTIVGYGLIVWSAWKPVSDVLPDRGLVIVAAVAFPPFWMLVLYGQISILILAAFWAGWVALERGRHFLAGAAFGLLAIKPQFGIPLAVVVLARRDWAMLRGAVASAGLQSAAVWVLLGPDAFRGFASTLSLILNNVDLLESKPIHSHSLRTLTRLLPNWIGIPLWSVAAGIVLWYTARIWKSDAPTRVRVGTVILASVLVNPHVIVYDAAVLAMPLIWFAAYMRDQLRQGFTTSFVRIVCWLFAAFFVPTSSAIGIQMSVLLMVWLLLLITRAALRPASELRGAYTARAA
jgi:alpha-1,2-mannosyltransferase